jgi:hypothetical protein
MEKECSYDQASPGANVDIHVDDANTGNSIENVSCFNTFKWQVTVMPLLGQANERC